VSCPGNISRVIRQFKKRQEVTNTQIVMAAGGSHQNWSEHLAGPKVKAITDKANLVLAEQNMQIVSLGIHRQRWKILSCAEAKIERAYQQTKKAASHLRNAKQNLWDVAQDERAPEKLRQDALAWLQLFNDEDGTQNILIFEEWAEELLATLPSPAVLEHGMAAE
jgi:hypothetical protein